jgi:tetratricopeptide (TPR) repeat protein
MGRVLLGLGDKEQALAVVSTVPHKARRPFVCWTLADCLTAVGRLDNARTVLTQSAQRDRRSRHKSLIKLARISYLEKDFAETVRLADEANAFHIQTFTTICADALFWAIGGHLALGNREKAVETLREIESHRPGYPYLNRLRRAVQERG